MRLCLREIRERLGLTQGDVATLAGCKRASISHWECGRQVPSLRMIPRLAAALQVPEALLLDLHPPAPRSRPQGRHAPPRGWPEATPVATSDNRSYVVHGAIAGAALCPVPWGAQKGAFCAPHARPVQAY